MFVVCLFVGACVFVFVGLERLLPTSMITFVCFRPTVCGTLLYKEASVSVCYWVFDEIRFYLLLNKVVNDSKITNRPHRIQKAQHHPREIIYLPLYFCVAVGS